MHGDLVRHGKTAGLAAALVGWSFAAPRIPVACRVPVQAGAGAVLALATRSAVGLRPPRLWSGLRVGVPVAAALAAGVAVSAAVPAVRAAMQTRALPESAVHWMVLHIPLGTVWAEETAFRAALATTAADGCGPAASRLLQAMAFGLFHIADARDTGQPIAPTVLVTGIAGWLFGWLADRSGSLVAPLLVHLAINEAGAAAVLAVRRRQDLGG